MNVELIYDQDCPNVNAAREAILCALGQINCSPRWTEWERSDPETPPYARAYGSPTVLIDGEDVAAADPSSSSDSCRLYANARGDLLRVPPVDLIVAGLEREPRPPSRTGFTALLAALPTGGALLLPIGACPVCWPAYTALLGSLGLGFLLSERYLLPVVGVFLIVTLATLAYRAPTRRGYRPFFLGLAGATIALVGKFVTSSDPVLYLGLAVIFAAAVWNARPRRQSASCRRCTFSQPEPQKEHSR